MAFGGCVRKMCWPDGYRSFTWLGTGKRGRPRKRCRWLLADKGYDADALRRFCDRYRMQPVIPLRAMARRPKPGLPRLFDRPKYRQRNVIERMFGWMKENLRLVTRFDKLAKSYGAMVSLACVMRCLRHLFQTEPRAGHAGGRHSCSAPLDVLYRVTPSYPSSLYE